MCLQLCEVCVLQWRNLISYTFLQASKPLQESLGLPLDKIRQEHQKASLLASPLYVLYAKVSAYRDAYGMIVMSI